MIFTGKNWIYGLETNISNMAYNKENLLRRIIEIQDIVLEYKKKDVPQRVIYDKHIKNQYYISYSCFNEYLGVPAKTELQKLLSKKGAKERNNPTLFEGENN
jgi:hypothetical protein